MSSRTWKIGDMIHVAVARRYHALSHQRDQDRGAHRRVRCWIRHRAATVTLVTCYPFYFIGDAPQRYIVKGLAEN